MTVQSHMQKPTLSVRPDVGLEYTVNVAIFAPTKLPYYIRTPVQKHTQLLSTNQFNLKIYKYGALGYGSLHCSDYD